MKKYLVVILVFISTLGFSQDIIVKGRVVNQKQEPLAFVNIGIKHTNFGTISDEEGYFKFIIDEDHINQNLSFSYLGYKDLSLKINHIKENDIHEFVMEETAFVLNEVTLISKKTKEKKIGTQSFIKFVEGYIWADNNRNKDIQEFAKKLNIKKPSKILNLNIALMEVTIDTAKFRINFYSVAHNLPYKKMGSQHIIVTNKIVNGWNSFDLRDFDLQFDHPIFITLEYLPEELDKEIPFKYSGQLLGQSIKKTSSMGDWEVSKGATIAMYATIQQ